MNSLTNHTELLNIFNFSSLTDFLQHYYFNQNKNQDHFTYENWSYHLGFKSRSFMYLVATNRRSLSPESAEILARYFNFNEKERQYFFLLAHVSKKENNTIENILKDKVLENFNFNEEKLTSDKAAILLSSPTLPLIKLLLACKDIEGTKNDIQKYIKIDDQALAADLEILLKNNFIVKSHNLKNEIIYKTKESNFKITDDSSPAAIQKFHDNVLNETIEINQKNTALKKLRSLMFILSDYEFFEIEQDIECFLNKIKNKCLTPNIKSKNIFRFNIHFYKIKNDSFEKNI